MKNRKAPGLHPGKDWLVLSAASKLTLDEVVCMLGDIRHAIGSLTGTARFLDVGLRDVSAWIAGRRKPVSATRRLIFISWLLICRPGIRVTYLDIICNGRTTKRGNPATAGGYRHGSDLSQQTTEAVSDDFLESE